MLDLNWGQVANYNKQNRMIFQKSYQHLQKAKIIGPWKL